MAALLIGSALPCVANVMYVSGLNPIPGMDWTPITFALTGLILAWGIFRQQMFTLVPVARERLIEGMADGVVVVDASQRIVDVNPSALAIIGRPPRDTIGQPAAQVLTQFGNLTELLRAGEEVATQEVSLGEEEAVRYYDLRASLLRDRRGQPTGRLIVMRDITRRRKAEQERERLISELQDALAQVRTLRGLLPICANCKRIRDDQGYWRGVEEYVAEHSDADFTHGICPDCARKLYPELFEDEK
jgi:PAS domain S-box-containing protein